MGGLSSGYPKDSKGRVVVSVGSSTLSLWCLQVVSVEFDEVLLSFKDGADRGRVLSPSRPVRTTPTRDRTLEARPVLVWGSQSKDPGGRRRRSHLEIISFLLVCTVYFLNTISRLFKSCCLIGTETSRTVDSSVLSFPDKGKYRKSYDYSNVIISSLWISVVMKHYRLHYFSDRPVVALRPKTVGNGKEGGSVRHLTSSWCDPSRLSPEFRWGDDIVSR